MFRVVQCEDRPVLLAVLPAHASRVVRASTTPSTVTPLAAGMGLASRSSASRQVRRWQERELEALFGRALSPTTGVALGSPWRADAVTGYDLTFSAPKSVSTLWALGDARTMAEIDAAHAAAVNAALGYLEAPRVAVAARPRRCRADRIGWVRGRAVRPSDVADRGSAAAHPRPGGEQGPLRRRGVADVGRARDLPPQEVRRRDLPDRAARGADGAVAGVVRAGVRARAGRDRRRPRGADDRVVDPDDARCWPTRSRRSPTPKTPWVARCPRRSGRGSSRPRCSGTRPAKDAPVPEGDRRARWVAQAAALGFAADAVTDSVQAANACREQRAGAGRGGRGRC